MTVESATYISDLNAANPGSTDLKAEGDDHLRLIKTVTKATFPNVTGAVTATHTALNNAALAVDANRAVNAFGALVSATGPKVAMDYLGSSASRILTFGAAAGTVGSLACYQASSDNSINRTAWTTDSSGNFCVGLTTPVATGGVTPKIQCQTTSTTVAGVGAYSADGTNNVRSALFADGTNGYAGLDVNYTTGFNGYSFRVVGVEKLKMDGTGNITPGTTNTQTMGGSSLRWSNVYSVLGNFSGIVNASAGINFGGSTLSTWTDTTSFTPVLTGIGTPTYTTQTGEYSRIGNRIKFRISLAWTAGTNAAAITGITGLPTSSTAAIHVVQLFVNLSNSTFTFTGSPIAYLNGSATINVGIQGSGAGIASLLNVNAGTKDIYLAGEYFV